MPSTPLFALPYPLSSDPADVPADLQALAVAIETALQSVVAPPAVMPGVIEAFGGLTPPAGYLACDGSTVLRTAYPALFAAIGVSWNTGGEAGTVFRLPDYRGRTIVGIGTHADVNALNDNDGLTVNSRRPAHKTSIADPGHFHSTGVGGTSPFAGGATAGLAAGSTNSGTKVTGITAGPQTGAEPTDTPAYAVALIIIKT